MRIKTFHNFKKNFGQNFIKSSETIQRVINYLDIQPTDRILEIGPGDGRFTEEILKHEFEKLTLVEIDRELIEFLNIKFEEQITNNKLQITNQDILDLELGTLDLRFKVFGALPYNISKRIIAKFLESKNQPERMVFIVQKEVADDYVVQAPDASQLSNYIQIFAEVKLVKSIPKSQFHPMPKVDGGVLLIKPKKVDLKEGRETAKFIFNGFRNKRKKLSKVLNSIYREIDWVKIFEELEINPNARAQELEFEVWMKLFEEYKKVYDKAN